MHYGTLLKVTIVSLCTGASQAPAQINGLDLNDPANDNLVKVRYANTTAIPDGIAFASKVNGLKVLFEAHPDAVLAKLSADIGLSRSQSNEILESMISFYRMYEKDLDKRAYKIACSNGHLRVRGDAAFDTLSEFDELKAKTSQEHYEKFVRSLDPEIARRFQQALETAKLSMEYIVFDQRQLAKATGITNIDEEMKNLCRALAQSTGEYE